MAGLTNYSAAVDLDYSQYHKALLESVTARNRITELSKLIGRHGEAVPDATRVDYINIEILLNSVEKLMYPAADEWSEKIIFCLNRHAQAGVPGLTFTQIAAYINDAERLSGNLVSQGMEDAVKVTLDILVTDGSVNFADGMYSR